ncbi:MULTISPECIES: S1 family peptidase [Bradyrhizobium]|uniref:S1 family peptidase n=1 Tax=Bradyrhizobium elkanii TaxID=29448 RepID=UPI0004059D16|nr:serine protease [Bradyrhizobium elkanii]
MRKRIFYGALVVFVLLANTQRISAACVDPTQVAHSAVSIFRHFDDAERESHRGLVGVRGTGWFLSPTTIVTAEHVTAGMELSTQDWKSLEIVDGNDSQFIAARILRLAGGQMEKLAVIELGRAVLNAQCAAIRHEPLVPEEQVVALAYGAGRPQLVGGRFVRFGDGGKLSGMALLEMYEGENRLIIDHGASGAPVLDCGGRVTAVLSHVFTQNVGWAHRQIRTSTAWGMPNVASVPVQALEEFAETR